MLSCLANWFRIKIAMGFPRERVTSIIMKSQKIRMKSQNVKLLSHCRNPSQSIIVYSAGSGIKVIV